MSKVSLEHAFSLAVTPTLNSVELTDLDTSFPNILLRKCIRAEKALTQPVNFTWLT